VLISVVTSVRNGEKFLPSCLESVRTAAEAVHGQSSIAVEHVVCDGASTDGTVAILEGHSGVRWTSEQDSGQSEGFNKGVAMAKGEWICWLNADDELDPGALVGFLRTLERHPEADVIYGHVQFIDEESRPLWTSYQLPYRYSLIANNVYVPPTSGTFFRRDLLLKEPLDPSYHYVMDVEWFLRCGGRVHAVLCDSVFGRFRVSSQGKTSEHIRSGAVPAVHAEERERYRHRHIYPRWSSLAPDQARRRLERRQAIGRLYYYWLKLHYAPRYAADRLRRSSHHPSLKHLPWGRVAKPPL
jgi:glycosyltransferase involved in cell wall biosynthesis